MQLFKGAIDRIISSKIAEYLDKLPPAKLSRVVSALDLSDSIVHRMIDEAKGDRTIEIHFRNGDMAIVSNRTPIVKGGPGW